ncbi:MAG: hypothetical protein CMC35_03125 [Flavobacteriaceae bacterium]|nr:hypothetical protein [Flavobacteriaceae bacterium]|tara:strand:+ start:554 stop:754 length:201 start_codon:yes stop_codon:yes gene_type:complete
MTSITNKLKKLPSITDGLSSEIHLARDFADTITKEFTLAEGKKIIAEVKRRFIENSERIIQEVHDV